MSIKAYICIGAAVALAIILGVKSCDSPAPRQKVVYVTHTDTVLVDHFIPVIQGIRSRVKPDTVVIKDGSGKTETTVTLPCAPFSFDTVSGPWHISGQVDCQTAQVWNLYIRGGIPITHTDTVHVGQPNRPQIEHSFEIDAFAQTNIMRGFNLADPSGGLTFGVTIGTVVLYVSPQVSLTGIACEAGASVTLWQQ